MSRSSRSRNSKIYSCREVLESQGIIPFLDCRTVRSSQRGIGEHIKSTHGIDAFKCRYCDTRVGRYDNLSSHERHCPAARNPNPANPPNPSYPQERIGNPQGSSPDSPQVQQAPLQPAPYTEPEVARLVSYADPDTFLDSPPPPHNRPLDPQQPNDISPVLDDRYLPRTQAVPTVLNNTPTLEQQIAAVKETEIRRDYLQHLYSEDPVRVAKGKSLAEVLQNLKLAMPSTYDISGVFTRLEHALRNCLDSVKLSIHHDSYPLTDFLLKTAERTMEAEGLTIPIVTASLRLREAQCDCWGELRLLNQIAVLSFL